MSYHHPDAADFRESIVVLEGWRDELRAENASLKRRVERLELQVRELYARTGQGAPPDLEVRRPDPGEQGYRQPGVTWG